jgi:hypothetical protein
VRPRPDRRRPEPYYKVQYRDGVALAWKDHRREAFATLDEALAFVRDLTNAELTFRIVEFNAGSSTTVYQQP